MKAMFVLAMLGLTNADAVSKRQTPVENNPLGTPNLVVNGNFTNGTSGWAIQPAGTVQNGFLCVTVPANTAANASFLKTTDNFTEVKNDIYYLNFTAYASHAVNLWLNTQGFDPSAGGAPVNPNLNTTQSPLTTSPHAFTFPYSPANQGDNTTLTIFLGGSSVTTEICFANISIHRINRLPYYQDTGSTVKVNQLGYLPNGPKVATLFTQSKSAINWTVEDITGAAVATGMSTPFGNDTASGNNAHTIDFSDFSQEGSGFVLTTGTGATSYPFSISATLYDGLRQDAMQFFYQQRSGIAIDAELAGTQYARPAGHVQVPPNTGDLVTPCQYAWESNVTYGEPWTCNYTLDVTQGWYDAGDQGKYVVNGGIATAQLLMAYERSLYTVNNYSAQLGDGSLRIPERSNGYPDFLDEARWEMEFMLKMQVPAGSAPQLFNHSYIDMSGLVHHKMHGNQWTPLPTLPNTDSSRRELHRASTAATLNMVATAAMSARLWAQWDPAFAARCLSAARVAYAAAQRAPIIYASGNDWDLGGGAYSDDDVTDEFFWAAAEMYITTGESAFLSDLQANRYYTANATTFFPPGGFGWASTAALGALSLATVPNNLSNPATGWPHTTPPTWDVSQLIYQAAEAYLATQTTQPTGALLTDYPWGSNSNQLNCIQVLATAFDLSQNATYRSAALQGIDYIFGRNALAQSYVHGYGTKSTMNVHSRLYAAELSELIPQDVIVPRAPAGAMAGGANQSPADPPADDVLTDCWKQTCYVDDVNSYSTNEVAINWNSALVWVAAWAADQ